MSYWQTLSLPSLLIIAIAIEGLLVYVPFAVVGAGRLAVGYDWVAPRAMFDKLPAYAQRATWAHQNSFEAFMLFAAAALMAYVTGVNDTVAIWAVVAHLTARFFYSIFYILNVPLGRSLMFGIGSGGTAVLMALSILQVLPG